MSGLTIHFLNADHKLTAYREWLHSSLSDTYQRAGKVMHLPALDVVVKVGKFVIPEKGHLGYCPEAGQVYLTVDPENPAFLKNDAYSLERMFAHELHHAARWAGPGYGSTLGEVMVSEGLAGHFSLELFGGEPEPWESLTADVVHAFSRQIQDNWQRNDYDHSAWFYGTRDLPRWLGYSAGFIMVSRYLAASTHLRASMLSAISADDFTALF